MQITDEQIKEWKQVREHGDGRQVIACYNGIRPIRESDLSKAWKLRKGPEHVVEALATFYAKKISEKKSNKSLQ